MNDNTTLNQLSLFGVEIWRPVVGFPRYEISQYGTVRLTVDTMRNQHENKAGKIMKTHITRKGYEYVQLSNGSSRKSVSIHRLVLMAHVGMPPSEKAQCNHKDGNRRNNHISNLEWCDQTYNLEHSYRVLGRQPIRGENAYLAKLTPEKVISIRQLIATGLYSYAAIGKMFGVSWNAIRNIAIKKTWKHVT